METARAPGAQGVKMEASGRTRGWTGDCQERAVPSLLHKNKPTVFLRCWEAPRTFVSCCFLMVAGQHQVASVTQGLTERGGIQWAGGTAGGWG
jgi:hypothetical protein